MGWGGVAGILKLQNQKNQKFGNLIIGTSLKKCYTRNTVQVMLQSRNYDELPVQSVSLYFFHNHNFFKVLFPQIGSG